MTPEDTNYTNSRNAITNAINIIKDSTTPSRELSLVLTKLEEAQLWLQKVAFPIK